MTERKLCDVRFDNFQPRLADYQVGYSYVHPIAGKNGTPRRMPPSTDRWIRAKANIAASAIASGAEEFTVWGGLGARRWRRTVFVSQEEADAYFVRSIQNGAFTLKGLYIRSCVMRDRRLKRHRDRERQERGKDHP